jgi:ABC-type nitrate/sulfonate/bicarbonate transport system permease component
VSALGTLDKRKQHEPIAAGALGLLSSRRPTRMRRRPARVEKGARAGANRVLLAKVVPPVVTLAALFGLWEGLTLSQTINPILLPSPASITRALGVDFGLLANNTAVTVEEAVAGFFVGNIIALVLAVIFVHCKPIERALSPLAMVSQVIPVVALTPVLVLWLGHGESPKIVISAFLVFFPTLVNMDKGLRAADDEAGELLYTLSASWWQRLWKVRFPASLPYLFTALRIAACSCFVGAIVAEWIGSNIGLGSLIVIASTEYKVPELWAAVVDAVVLSMTAVVIIQLIERRVMSWPGANDHKGL